MDHHLHSKQEILSVDFAHVLILVIVIVIVLSLFFSIVFVVVVITIFADIVTDVFDVLVKSPCLYMRSPLCCIALP